MTLRVITSLTLAFMIIPSIGAIRETTRLAAVDRSPASVA